MEFILGWESFDDKELTQFITKEDAAYYSEEWCVVEADTLEEAELMYEETFLKWQESNN